MFQQAIQISQLSPDQFAELVETHAYNGMLRALADFKPPKQSELPDNLTRKQTAEYLQVSLVTLHDWSKDTDDRPAVLRPFKINGRVRYKRDDVLALESSKVMRYRPG